MKCKDCKDVAVSLLAGEDHLCQTCGAYFKMPGHKHYEHEPPFVTEGLPQALRFPTSDGVMILDASDFPSFVWACLDE